MEYAKILVVDDEKGIVDLLVENLSDEGFDVTCADNGASALVEIYQAIRFSENSEATHPPITYR